MGFDILSHYGIARYDFMLNKIISCCCYSTGQQQYNLQQIYLHKALMTSASNTNIFWNLSVITNIDATHGPMVL